ncbi:MAG TPA: cyclic nucleotide-binding domain-containing protein [Casimicrobiaceae bacterium]|nr:cyclic nucleotide-binding domain-containing protein [Casimicrobiaceae bacterium]
MDVFKEAEMLRRVPFFGGLDAAKLKLLAFTSRPLKFAPGEYLIKKGDASDSAYVILEGEAEVMGETGEGEFVVAVLRSNELIGEMGVIRNRPRGATVRAKTPVRALRIASDVFLGLISENPECALDVMRQLSARIDASNVRLAAAQRELESLRNHERDAKA